MAATKKSKSPSTDERDSVRVPSPREYNEFIAGVALENVRLARSELDALAEYDDGAFVPVVQESSVQYVVVDEGFAVLFELEFRGEPQTGGAPSITIRAMFELRYSSKVTVSDELFHAFRQTNLRVNVWPYFREFVQSSLSRAGWPVFVLPVLRTAPSPPA